MKLTLEGVLRAMTQAGAALPAFSSLLDQVIGLFDAKDQAVLRQAYEDAKAENDAGHAQLQAKLKAAAGR